MSEAQVLVEEHDFGAYPDGSRADLTPGDLLPPGRESNVVPARADISIVDPGEDIEDDPKLTHTKFPGSPTLSYRTRRSVEIID